MEVDTQSISIRDLIRIIFRRKLLILIPIIPATLTAYILFELQTPVYEATVKVMIAGKKVVDVSHYKFSSGEGYQEIRNQNEIIGSRYVLERTVKALKLYETPVDYEKKFASPLKAALIDYRLKKFNRLRESRRKQFTPEEELSVRIYESVNELASNVSTKPVVASSFFTISVKDFDPVRAAIIANSVSRSYVMFDLEQQISENRLQYGEKHSDISRLEMFIENMEKTLDGKPLSAIEAMGPASIKIMEQARVTQQPEIEADKLRKSIIVFLLSIVFGLVVAFVKEYLDQTLKSPKDIETFLNIPFLGFIPKRKFKDKLPIGRDTNPDTDFTRSYERLTEQVSLLIKDKNLRSILITGVEPSEDIATVIAGLGIYLARKGYKKLLIMDANLRNPSISKIFNISDNSGLANVLKGGTSFEDAIQNLETNLYILPSSNTEFNPTILLSSSAMSDVIRNAKDKYEAILISCANLKDFTDAAVLSSITDGIILVINEGKTKRPVIINALAPLKQKKANLIGAILNNRSFEIPKWIYDRI